MSCRISSLQHLFLGVILLTGFISPSTSFSGGPVYINPNAASSSAPLQPSTVAGGRLTQTVYGFLDFTTTIGNTVMVFSPQSAPAPGVSPTESPSLPTTSSPPTPEPVIETRPAASIEHQVTPSALHPSKTVPTPAAAPIMDFGVPGAVPAGFVQVQPENPQPNKPDIGNVIFSSVVEIRGGEVSQPVVATPAIAVPVLSSKVEVREGSSSILKLPKKASITPPKPVSSATLSSRVEVRAGPVSGPGEQPPQPARILSSHVEVVQGSVAPTTAPGDFATAFTLPTPPLSSSVLPSKIELLSSKVEILTSSDEPAISGNNLIGGPEYDFLSRQPVQIVDETYKVIELRPSNKKPQGKSRLVTLSGADDGSHPTGLVTRLGGTVVKDGATTVHETSVIGTFISGKYAQVLQSTSHVVAPKVSGNKVNLRPSASTPARILKTAAPALKSSKAPAAGTASSSSLEPTGAGSIHEETSVLPLEALFSQPSGSNQVRPARRSGSSSKNDLKSRLGSGRRGGQNGGGASREQDVPEQDFDEDVSAGASGPSTEDPSAPKYKNSRARSGFNSRFGRGSASANLELATVSVFTESSATPTGSGRRYQTQPSRKGYRNSNSNSNTNANSNSNNGGSHSNSISHGSSESSTPRRGFKPRLHPSSADAASSPSQSTSLYKFKLTRPNGRWQYKTTPKPRINIRRQDEGQTPGDNTTLPQQVPLFSTSVSSSSSSGHGSDQESLGTDHELAADVNGGEGNDGSDGSPVPQPSPAVAPETVKVSISTPADFKDVYYEIATIKSPYTFQVGTVRNTRYITVTSTYEKTLQPTVAEALSAAPVLSPSEPLTENILATKAPIGYEAPLSLPLDSSVATLPPIGLGPDQSTPPLDTMTETFSTTQLLLKTHILPVVRGGGNTTLYTLVQSYHVTRLVTATKTLPPMEVYQFVPSKTLTEFNSRLDEAGSELHLELDFGDEANRDVDDEDRLAAVARVAPDLDLANIGSDFDVSDVDRMRQKKAPAGVNGANANALTGSSPSTPSPSDAPTTPLSQEQLQQLAILRFLNPQAAAALGPQVVTTSKPILKVETVYESHVVPVFNGLVTSLSTLSRPVSTVTRTELEVATTTVPPAAALPPLPVNPFNPLFPPAPNQFQITSSPVVTQTVITQTDSKVLKLTFGAKTAYTTLFSTRVVPTMLTTYLTASVPVQATAAPYGGFFPSPYGSFPYVG